MRSMKRFSTYLLGAGLALSVAAFAPAAFAQDSGASGTTSGSASSGSMGSNSALPRNQESCHSSAGCQVGQFEIPENRHPSWAFPSITFLLDVVSCCKSGLWRVGLQQGVSLQPQGKSWVSAPTPSEMRLVTRFARCRKAAHTWPGSSQQG